MQLQNLKFFFLIPIFFQLATLGTSCGTRGNPLFPEFSQIMRVPTKKSIGLLPYLDIIVEFEKGISAETRSLIGKTLDSIRIIFHLPHFEETLQKFITPNEQFSIILDEPSYSIARKYTTENSYIGELLYYVRNNPVKITFVERYLGEESVIFQFQTIQPDVTFESNSTVIVNSLSQKKILETPISLLVLQLSHCVLQIYAEMSQIIPKDKNLLLGISNLFGLFYKRNQTLPELSRIFHGYQFYIQKSVSNPIPQK